MKNTGCFLRHNFLRLVLSFIEQGPYKVLFLEILFLIEDQHSIRTWSVNTVGWANLSPLGEKDKLKGFSSNKPISVDSGPYFLAL